MIIFDVDGVLVDSQDAHWRFMEDQAKKYGLKLKHDNAQDAVVPVGPMSGFILAAGFPPEYVPVVLKAYIDEFATNYPCFPFHGVAEMLLDLKESNIIGIASSNNRNNVTKSLGDELFELFDFVATQGDYKSKGAAILKAEEIFGEDIIMIGDMESDYEAAVFAGAQFVGCRYGWAISENEKRFRTVGTVQELHEFLRCGL